MATRVAVGSILEITSMPSDWAMQKAADLRVRCNRAFVAACEATNWGNADIGYMAARDTLAAALDQVRRETIEECAVIAESGGSSEGLRHAEKQIAADIADAIRAGVNTDA